MKRRTIRFDQALAGKRMVGQDIPVAAKFAFDQGGDPCGEWQDLLASLVTESMARPASQKSLLVFFRRIWPLLSTIAAHYSTIMSNSEPLLFCKEIDHEAIVRTLK